jgi:chromosome segregation protein
VDATHSEHDLMKSNVHRLTAEAQAIQLNMHESEKSYAVTQAKKDSLLKEIERLTVDTRNRQSELHELSDKSKAALQAKESQENSYQSLLNEEVGLQADSGILEEESKLVADELLDCSRKLDARQNEYNLTRSLVENLEGYPESLRFLRKNSASSTQTPLFSDILNCRSEYKSAIETYLEPFMNYFVIDDIEEASRAVNLLSEAAKGRANFFILKNFDNEQHAVPEDLDGCVHALNIIDTEPQYRSLCHHLLKNVYIVTEEQDRTPFMQNGSTSHVFISQNGKYCKTRHSLSGGSVGMFDGKRMGRAKHLENLAKEIETLTAVLEEITNRRDGAVQELSRLRQNRDRIATDKNRLLQEVTRSTNEYSSLHHKAEHLEVTVLNNNSIIADLNGQLIELDSAIEKDSLSLDEQLKALKTQYESITAELTQMQLQFNEVVARLNQQSADYNNHHIQCIHQQNKIATLVRDLNYKFNLRETLGKSIETNTVELEKILEQIQDLLSHSTDFDSQLVSLYAEKDTLEKSVAVIEADYFKSRALIDETEAQIRTIRHQKEQCEQLGQSVKDRTTELKIMLSSLKERLSAEFDLILNDLMDRDPSPDWTEEELREKVNKQKSQLDNYGPINPMAVEAFNEIKDRHTFITAQKEDLAKAKESLLQTINEIEMTARENFMTAFTQVRENFIRVFRSLFSEEDQCDLRLLDPENPTESEIQIIAQPKGKRPLSISQLSGGEKTLTATALLFGIYLLKPAPFCIFDEVDAPLDDNNIDKFNNIIKKFSEESQFIIITHNKRTMAATDIMYGITMIEQGVTQVVPVDLAEMVS